MACNVEKVGRRKFKVKPDDKVRLAVRVVAPPGAPKGEAEIIQIKYNDSRPSKTPEFTAVEGTHELGVLYECSKNGLRVRLVEDCGEPEHILDEFNFDATDPLRKYSVSGA